jgi:NifB/MoaA-like Fe-S oxidoreductase
VNDGAVLDRSLTDLYALGSPVLSASVVPVGLTEFSKHHRVREPSLEECRAAVGQVERWQRHWSPRIYVAVHRKMHRTAAKMSTQTSIQVTADCHCCMNHL